MEDARSMRIDAMLSCAHRRHFTNMHSRKKGLPHLDGGGPVVQVEMVEVRRGEERGGCGDVDEKDAGESNPCFLQ